MNHDRCLASHAAKGALGVSLAALLLAWPPACSWIVAVYLLLWAADQLRLSFREIEHADGIRGGVGVPARRFTEAEVVRVDDSRQPAAGPGGVPARPGSPLV